MLPRISIILVCRNEEKYIEKCLDSVLDNGYPADKMDIVVVDGESTDKTRDIVRAFQEKTSCVRLVSNPGITAAAGLNVGLKAAHEEFIVRLDAHASYEKDYLLKSVTYLERYQADNVGGVIETVSSEDTLIGRSIARLLSSSFGVGLSHFRIGVNAPSEVATVPFGSFRKSFLEKLGGFDEDMTRCEDIDMNLRIKAAGGKIMLFPDIKLRYFSRTSLIPFLRHTFNNGYLITVTLKHKKFKVLFYHIVPLLAVATGLTLIVGSVFSKLALGTFLLLSVVYLFITLVYTTSICRQSRDIRYAVTLPWLFFVTHVAYGLGSIWGILIAAGDLLRIKPRFYA